MAEKTITKIEGKIPSISDLAASISDLVTDENKIPNIRSLVKKEDYNTKTTEIEKNLLIMTIINILLLQNLIV